MNKTKIYLDTSVISYLDQTDAPAQMEITKALWKRFQYGQYKIFLSTVTIDEIARCQKEKRLILGDFLEDIIYTELQVTDETTRLAEKIIYEGILTQKSYDDCLHIACATLAECDIILSWNFKHLVNIKTINGVRGINMLKGYKSIDIYSPDMIFTEE
jgi:predicted nucleic acid-binding protein